MLLEVVLCAAFVGTCVMRVSFGLAMINSIGFKLFVVSGLWVLVAPATRAFLSCDWVIAQEAARGVRVFFCGFLQVFCNRTDLRITGLFKKPRHG